MPISRSREAFEIAPMTVPLGNLDDFSSPPGSAIPAFLNVSNSALLLSSLSHIDFLQRCPVNFRKVLSFDLSPLHSIGYAILFT